MSSVPAGAVPSPEVDDFLCFAVYSIGLAFNRVYKPLLDELGLTYPQYLVMTVLWAKDDQTVGEVGETLFLDSSTLTPLLKRLEAAGSISRSRDPVDERQVRIRLTEAGDAARVKARDIPNCINAATGRSQEDLRRLVGEIAAMRRCLLKSTGR